MHLGWIGASIVAFGAFSAGGAYAYIDSVAGEGTARAAVQYGTGNAAGVAGDAAAVPVQVAQQIKPALAAAANEASGLAGGMANGTTPTTAAGEYGDPSEGGQG